MKKIVKLTASGKSHYVIDGKTACGRLLEDVTLFEVSSVSVESLCKKCYEVSVQSSVGTSRVELVSDEFIEPVEEFVTPVRGEKV